MRMRRVSTPSYVVLLMIMLLIFSMTLSRISINESNSENIENPPSDNGTGETIPDGMEDRGMTKEFPHWKDTPVTRDPSPVPYEKLPLISENGGSIKYLYSSDDLLEGAGFPLESRRNDPPLVDLYVEETLSLLPLVSDSISQYVTDKTILGDYIMDVYAVSGVGAQDFRDNLITSHENGMTGAILLGDLPEMIFEMDDSFGSYDSFPCDLYFMDLDGVWMDNNSNNKMDYHGGDLEADIWISRIKPSVITTELENNLAIDYFGKVHDYFTGELSYNHSALLYIDDDWAAWGDLYAWNISSLYPNAELVDEHADTNGADYIDNRVTEGYEFIQVHVHSSPTLHYFDQGGTVSAAQVRNAPPRSLFMNLFCCSGSDYDAANNFGATYLFFGDGLATIGSTKTGSMLNFGDFYIPMANGRSIGEAFLDWSQKTMERSRAWHYGMSLQGDGLLSPGYEVDMSPPTFSNNMDEPIRINMSSDMNISMDMDVSTPNGFPLDRAEYRINGGQWIEIFNEDCKEYRIETNLSKNEFSEGNNTVEIRAYTIFQAEGYYNLTFLKDTLPPSDILISVDGGKDYVNEREVTLLPEAWDVSGIEYLSVSSDSENWSPWEVFAPPHTHLLEDRDGVHEIFIRLADSYFNIGSAHQQVELDRTPPRDCNITINDGNPFTSTREINITISAGEDLANLTGMSVSTTGQWIPDWMQFEEESNFQLQDEEGPHQIFLKVMDRANNTSPTLSSIITYDPGSPFGLRIIANNGKAITNRTNVTLELEARDNTSGVERMRFSFDGIRWGHWEDFNRTVLFALPEGDGVKKIFFQAMDRAGNAYTRTDANTTIILDTIPPASEAIAVYAENGLNGWYTSKPNIDIDHSGVNAYYRWGSEGDFLEFLEYLIPPEGINVLYYYSVDEAGNREWTNERTFRVDSSAPAASVTDISEGKKNNRGWYACPVILDFSTDMSGPSAEAIRLETSTDFELNDTRLTIDIDGIHNITYWAEDEAGNIGPKRSVLIKIDRKAPDLYVQSSIDEKKLILDYQGTDELGSVTYRINPGDGSESLITRDRHWEHEYEPGSYNILIECTDESGLVTREYVNISMENDLLGILFTEGKVTVGGYIAAGVIIFALLVVVLVVRRKKRKSEFVLDSDPSEDEKEIAIAGSEEKILKEKEGGPVLSDVDLREDNAEPEDTLEENEYENWDEWLEFEDDEVEGKVDTKFEEDRIEHQADTEYDDVELDWFDDE